MLSHEQVDMFFGFDYFVFFHDVLYSTLMTHLFWDTLPVD